MVSLSKSSVTLTCAVVLAFYTWSANAGCPTSVDPFFADITQVYNGVPESYKWTLSLTKPVDSPPPGARSCGEQAFISQFDAAGDCSSTVQSKTGFNPTGSGCDFMYHDAIRLATVSLECDAGASSVQMASTVTVTNAEGGKYKYDFKGRYAGVCGGGGDDEGPKGSGGCGGGCVFVIIFFVGAALYVAGTVAFNYFKLNKRGKELAPHPEFWLLIPGLIKDGAIFSFQMATKPCRKDEAGSTYTQV